MVYFIFSRPLPGTWNKLSPQTLELQFQMFTYASEVQIYAPTSLTQTLLLTYLRILKLSILLFIFCKKVREQLKFLKLKMLTLLISLSHHIYVCMLCIIKMVCIPYISCHYMYIISNLLISLDLNISSATQLFFLLNY